jgi:thiol-disulfide isomerase/thioredoxin
MGTQDKLLTFNWTLFLPPCAALYLLYAQLEEEWGLARHAMAVYDRATRAVEPAQQYDMFNIYIKRAAEIYGVTHTRGIYQKAIEVPATPEAQDWVGGWRSMKGS